MLEWDDNLMPFETFDLKDFTEQYDTFDKLPNKTSDVRK